MIHTELRDLLAVEHPIVQAPIGPAAGPELAAAVAEAGGLGMLAVTWADPDEARTRAEATRERTDGAFGVNVVLDEATSIAPPMDLLDACLAADVDLVSFAWGEAAPYVEQVHAVDAMVCQTVGSADAARRAVDAGVDLVVAQGWEAGGHVQSDVATLPLVPRVVEAVDVPVLAAGGIADGRGIAAVLALGAAGAWLGTRFVATAEARTHPVYREAVTAATETETVATTLFDRGWPDATHRVLANSTVAAWEAAGRPGPGDRPGEDDDVAQFADGTPIPRYAAVLPEPGMTGDIDAMAAYAGQSAGGTDSVEPAGEVLETLVAETAAAIRETEGLLT